MITNKDFTRLTEYRNEHTILHKMSVFYEIGINVNISLKNGFIWFLVLQQLSVRQSVKLLSKHLSMDLALITKKVRLLDKK